MNLTKTLKIKSTNINKDEKLTNMEEEEDVAACVDRRLVVAQVFGGCQTGCQWSVGVRRLRWLVLW